LITTLNLRFFLDQFRRDNVVDIAEPTYAALCRSRPRAPSVLS